MALPIVETPRYELTLPSQETKYNIDLFLLKKKRCCILHLNQVDEKEMQTQQKKF